MKEIVKPGLLWKIWKETAYIELRTGKIMPEGGDFVSLCRPGGRSFALKNCPRGGDFDGKNKWPGG